MRGDLRTGRLRAILDLAAWPVNPELLHLGVQCRRLQAKDLCCAAASADAPPRQLQCTSDGMALGVGKPDDVRAE
jgi:hypothetical protein